MKQKWKRWLDLATEDSELMQELTGIANADEEIEDRFYRNLEFGTGGLRGVIGAGTNRMNIYTIRKATQGLANYIKEIFDEDCAVAIAHDSRIKSDLFAREAARVLAANGITVHLYPTLMPTPALSFAVRELHCCAGICVTASHNPAKYNGYKVYGADGCQITLEAAEKILSYIEATDPFDGVQVMPFDAGVEEKLIRWIPETVTEAFLDAVEACRMEQEDCSNLELVYTPLNGAGLHCVTQILKRIGVSSISVVPEQENPDGNFPTCPYPNPEISEALHCGLKLCQKKQPDLLLATDPDCDRVGIAVGQNGTYHLVSGNEVGVLLLDYIAKRRTEQGRMPKHPIAVKTIVTTELAQQVADHYGIELRNVLTGFKFIGEQIGLLEQDGEEGRYIFGFEESYGYLSGSYVRDKDAVDASMLICEMASYYKKQGKTLLDVLEELYQQYGYSLNALDTLTYEGASGSQQMKQLMQSLRMNKPNSIGGMKLRGALDYLGSTGSVDGKDFVLTLPISNILEFPLEHNCKVIVRPSGTEPKIKLYFSAQGKTPKQAQERIDKMMKDCRKLLNA